jgi:DNA-binding MarR family transcriptional regulator
MSRESEHPPPALEYLTQLHRAVHAVGLFVEARFGPDVSQAEALVLVQLFVHGPGTINEVHRRFLHRRSTLTSVLDRLEKKGLLSRRPDANDRRSIHLALTRSGRGIAAQIAGAFEKICAPLSAQKTMQSASALLGATAEAFHGFE